MLPRPRVSQAPPSQTLGSPLLDLSCVDTAGGCHLLGEKEEKRGGALASTEDWKGRNNISSRATGAACSRRCRACEGGCHRPPALHRPPVLPPCPLPFPPRDDSPRGGWREHPRAGPHECHFSLSFRGLSDNAKEVIMQRRLFNERR